MRLLIGLLLLCASAIPAFAQDADEAQRKTVARDLVQLTTADAVMTPMVDAIWPTLETQISAGAPAPIDAEVMQSLKAAFTSELLTTMASVVDDYAALYAENFTLDELTEIVAFYKSDAGGKLVAVQPKIMNEMLPTLTQKLQVSLPVAMESVMRQAQEKGVKTQ